MHEHWPQWEEDSYQQLIDTEYTYIAHNRNCIGKQMDLSQAFPSKWLKGEDIKGRDVPVEVLDVTLETLKNMQGQEETKIAVWFRGKEKALLLNKTNYQTLAEVWGSDSENWKGKGLTLFTMKVQSPDGLRDGIRVKPDVEGAREQVEAEELNDDIPF